MINQTNNNQLIEILEELYRQNILLIHKVSEGKPWYETLAPLFYTLVGAIVAFYAQWRIFKLNEKKELKRDLGRLYAEFSFNSKGYQMLFFDNCKSYIEWQMVERRLNYYSTAIKSCSSVENDLHKILINCIKQERESLIITTKIKDDNLKKFLDLAFKTERPLYELQLLVTNKGLDQAIAELNSISIYAVPDNEKIDINVLESPKLMGEFVGNKMLDRSLELAKKIEEVQAKIKAIVY